MENIIDSVTGSSAAAPQGQGAGEGADAPGERWRGRSAPNVESMEASLLVPREPPCPINLPSTGLMCPSAQEPQQLVELTCMSDAEASADAPTSSANSTGSAGSPPHRAARARTSRAERTDSQRSWGSLRTASSCSADIEALEASANEAAATAAALQQQMCSAVAAFEVHGEPPTEVKFLHASLAKKAEECEHLRGIIKELSQSRHKLQRTKVDMEEAYVSLQKEYCRVLKVAELARTVSAQSISRSSKAKTELQEAQDAASRSARAAEKARDVARRLRAENGELKRRVALLEQLAVADDCRLSASLREYIFAHQVSLY